MENWDLRPSDIKNEELDGIRFNDYIEWCVILMKAQMVWYLNILSSRRIML